MSWEEFIVYCYLNSWLVMETVLTESPILSHCFEIASPQHTDIV